MINKFNDFWEDFENPIDEESDQFVEPDCTTGAWTQWTKCSVTCGKGISMRQRVYSNPMKAKMAACGRQMVQKEMCSAKMTLCDGKCYLINSMINSSGIN